MELKKPNTFRLKNESMHGDYPNGHWYRQIFDKNGLEILFESSSGKKWEYAYDKNGNRTLYKTRVGNIHEIKEYNDKNEVIYWEYNGEIWRARPFSCKRLLKQIINGIKKTKKILCWARIGNRYDTRTSKIIPYIPDRNHIFY